MTYIVRLKPVGDIVRKPVGKHRPSTGGYFCDRLKPSRRMLCEGQDRDGQKDRAQYPYASCSGLESAKAKPRTVYQGLDLYIGKSITINEHTYW